MRQVKVTTVQVFSDYWLCNENFLFGCRGVYQNGIIFLMSGEGFWPVGFLKVKVTIFTIFSDLSAPRGLFTN